MQRAITASLSLSVLTHESKLEAVAAAAIASTWLLLLVLSEYSICSQTAADKSTTSGASDK
jgi:hypothetical protein